MVLIEGLRIVIRHVLSFQGFTGALEEYNNNRFGIVQKNEINHSRKDSL